MLTGNELTMALDEKYVTEDWLDNMAYQLEQCYVQGHLLGVMKIQDDMKKMGYGTEAQKIINNLRELTHKKHVLATLNHA